MLADIRKVTKRPFYTPASWQAQLERVAWVLLASVGGGEIPPTGGIRRPSDAVDPFGDQRPKSGDQ